MFKTEKSISLFARRSKLPSTKRVTLKTIADTIVSLSHDAQDDMPSNSVVVLERYNVTGASGVIKRYPNGSDFKMELTFRLNRNGVASLDSSEVMLEDRVEYEKCEFVKPAPPPKANATKKEADSTPASETDESAAKDAPKDDESNPKSDSDSKKGEEGGEQSGGTQDEKQAPKDDTTSESTSEEKQVRARASCACAGWHVTRRTPPRSHAQQVDVVAENSAFLEILQAIMQAPDVAITEINTDGSEYDDDLFVMLPPVPALALALQLS